MWNWWSSLHLLRFCSSFFQTQTHTSFIYIFFHSWFPDSSKTHRTFLVFKWVFWFLSCCIIYSPVCPPLEICNHHHGGLHWQRLTNPKSISQGWFCQGNCPSIINEWLLIAGFTLSDRVEFQASHTHTHTEMCAPLIITVYLRTQTLLFLSAASCFHGATLRFTSVVSSGSAWAPQCLKGYQGRDMMFITD